MNAPLDRKAALQGMGDSRLRKEDARFIQGKGHYVDDIKLPGMLHMDIVRSPLAHARIKKINKDVIFAWSQILKNTSNSKLYLKSNEFNNIKFKENFEKSFEKLGVLKEKLILENQSERKKLLECYNKIDIALDTFPYTGGTTNLELSYMCVPLITISGETFLSRCGVSVNKNLGMNELIAKNIDEYVEIAINLAKDKNKLSMIKAELLKNSRKSKLFDIEIFSRDFTNAIQDMWKNFLHHNFNIKK